jgi:hypothetical protein
MLTIFRLPGLPVLAGLTCPTDTVLPALPPCKYVTSGSPVPAHDLWIAVAPQLAVRQPHLGQIVIATLPSRDAAQAFDELVGPQIARRRQELVRDPGLQFGVSDDTVTGLDIDRLTRLIDQITPRSRLVSLTGRRIKLAGVVA